MEGRVGQSRAIVTSVCPLEKLSDRRGSRLAPGEGDVSGWTILARNGPVAGFNWIVWAQGQLAPFLLASCSLVWRSLLGCGGRREHAGHPHPQCTGLVGAPRLRHDRPRKTISRIAVNTSAGNSELLCSVATCCLAQQSSRSSPTPLQTARLQSIKQASLRNV